MSRWNEIIKIRAETNKIENRKTMGKKSNETNGFPATVGGLGKQEQAVGASLGARPPTLSRALTVVSVSPTVVGAAVLTAIGMQFVVSSSGTL